MPRELVLLYGVAAGQVERSETHRSDLQWHDGFHFIQPILRALMNVEIIDYH
jgi:hypothetical protein